MQVYYKMILIKAIGVGKSSILLRFVTQDFKENPDPTLGAAFMSKKFDYNSIPIKYQVFILRSQTKNTFSKIWDTAGQEKYHALAPMYYKDSHVAIIVYDITQKNSFEVLKKWINELEEFGPRRLLIAIVGNKIDLIEQEKV